MFRILGKICILLTAFFIIKCSSSEKFRKLHSIQENFSDFYLIRPFSPALSLWSFSVKVSKYRDKFNPDEKPEQVKDFSIRVGHYIHLRLPKGHYKLSSPFFKNSEKIIFIDGKKEKFIHFYLFSDVFFSGTELFFQEIEKKEALTFLLEGSNMSGHPESDP